jgi:Spy/CpxP family protein refolding chaperone
MKVLTILFAHLILLGPAAAAPGKDSPTRVAQRPDAPGTSAGEARKAKNRKSGATTGSIENKREKVRQQIRALRAWRLTEALDLDEKTAAALFPVINQYDDRFETLTAAGARIHRELRRAVADGDDARTEELVDELVEHQRALWKLQEDRFRDVRKVLTPEQAARILILLPEIDRAIHAEIRKAMRSRAR